MRQRLEARIVEHGLECGDVAGTGPIEIVRGQKLEEARKCFALLGRTLPCRDDPRMPADELDMLTP